MFDYIIGKLVSKNYPHIVVECNNIGYSLLTNIRTINSLPELDSDVKIYTKLIHREDTMFLCGFLAKEDRVIFDTLTSVSGVGVKMALKVFDEFSSSELISAVLDGDYKLISKAKGIGPKLAQKIILELKDKLTQKEFSTTMLTSKVEGKNIDSEIISEVQTILISLGYNDKEIESAILNISPSSKDDAQEILRLCLTQLSNG